ncbi:MAG: rhomboid family intramembrane serine protease [Saprospiraceae bacterium]|nr:rhomboid family intramembrane serine protease [Saprospiraceae bacterium]
MNLDLRRLGVFPREVDGLPGILTGPLIHGSWEHLFSNSVSFIMLGAVLFWFYPRIALRSIIWLYLLSGFGIWISGQPFSYHIGASGIVYGMVSLVFWSGVFRRNVKSIVLALIILVMYAGFFEGIVPGKEGISWEGHLSGAIAGILLAFVYRRDVEEDEVVPEVEEEVEERHYYLPRDTFDMTMAERRALWESRNEQ